MTSLLLVAHGSRDPRSAEALAGLAASVASRAAGGDEWEGVDLAFLEFSSPLLEDVAGRLTGDVVVVPLLLAEAFHARFDLPGRLAAIQETHGDVRFTRTDVLGPSHLLDDAVARRAAHLRSRGCDGVVLLGTGSSRRRANGDVDEVAARVGGRLGLPAAAAFVTRGRDLEAAVADLHARGARHPGIVPWFLAPGRLLDAGIEQAASSGVDAVAGPLADDPLLVDLVLARAGIARGLAAAA